MQENMETYRLKFTEDDPLVLSSSGLIAYGRCPKSFELGYVNRWRMRPKDCMSQGTEFHKLMEMLYKGASEDEISEAARAGEWPEMYDVFIAYRTHWGHKFPTREKVLSTEEPLYTRLLPNVWLRTTFDRIWNDDGEITDDDFKTFEKNMQLDLSLDTQGRLFLVVLQKQYTEFKRFKRRYLEVRRMPPFVPKNETQRKAQANGKPFESWGIDECYKDHTLRLIPGEADVVWKDAQHRARKILFDLETREKDPTAQVFDRVHLKGHSPYCCEGQICRTLCMKELVQGAVNEIDLITEGVTIEPPLTLPEGLLHATT